jgi:hypothetical protein
MRIPHQFGRDRALIKKPEPSEAVAEDDGYDWPFIDDILADEVDSVVGKPSSTKPSEQTREDQVSGPAHSRCGPRVYVIEVIIKYDGDASDGLLSERIGGLLKPAGIDVVRFAAASAVDVLPWPVPSPGAGGVAELVPRVHRVGAPRKWSEDLLARASEALPSVLTQEQRRERRRAQVAAASRRLRERRRSGALGTPD